MESGSPFKKWLVPLVALIVGAAGGYWGGMFYEKSAEGRRAQAAEAELVKSVNPFEQASANPYDKTPANPYEKVKVNPFE